MNYENLKLSRDKEVWVQITQEVVPYIRPHYYISNWGRIGSTASGNFEIISLVHDNDGYLSVCLHLYLNIIDNAGYAKRQINKRVNRLVIMSFYPIPINYDSLEVNHINSIRDDNHLWNLEWVTSKENTLHALTYGHKEIMDIRGSKNPMAKLTENDIYKITDLVNCGYPVKEIAKMFNVGSGTILDIINRKSWSHLNLNINQKNITSAFTNEEMKSICEFFDNTDINNKSLYPKTRDLLLDCFYSLGLDKKYNFESKRKTLFRILNKLRYDEITSKYNYKFIR